MSEKSALAARLAARSAAGRAGAPDARSLVDAAATRRVPLSVIALDEPDVTAVYEKPLVLVRPDGHVAWRGDGVPADALRLIDTIRGA